MLKVENHKVSERRAARISTVPELLKVMAGHGDKILFSYFKGKEVLHLTYRDFVDRVYRVAAGLRKMGLDTGRTAVVGETSPEWLETYLATLLCGGVIIPMDKELTPEQISNFLEVAEADAIVFSPSFNSSLTILAEHKTVKHLIPMSGEIAIEDQSKVLSLDSIRCMGAEQLRSGASFPTPDLEKMCEMLFTSGTTGTSKCVMLSQKNVMSVVQAATFSVEFYPEDVTVSVLPVHHTYELMCLLAQMNYGTHICINDSLRHVIRNFQKFQPTALILVPLFVNTIYKRIWSEAEKKGKDKKLRFGIKLSRNLRKMGIDKRRTLFKDVLSAFGGKLERVICGGAALNPTLIQAFDDFGIAICEGFGITECSPLAAVTPYYKRKPGSVGPAVPCCTLRIDGTGKNEQGFTEGEIQVKGDNVMLGYYKNDEANAAVFTKDGWFRTGDFGYMDADGYLYITGRLKSVIVLENGKNVFPEEVEEYLEDVDEILETVVVGRTQEDGTVLLCAVTVPNTEKFPEGAEMESMKKIIEAKIDDINRRLPSFKQIRIVEMRAEPFEKTTTKKIKRSLVK